MQPKPLMSCCLVLIPIPIGLGLCWWGFSTEMGGGRGEVLGIAGFLMILLSPVLILMGPSLTKAFGKTQPLTTLKQKRAARFRRKE